MIETINLTLSIVRFSSIAFVVFAIFGICIFVFTKDKNRLYKNYKLLMPLYYMFFSITVFCGIILLAFSSFYISIRVFLMILTSIIILTTSIKSYKYSKNPYGYEKFKGFTCKKYISDVVLVMFIFLAIRFIG